MAIMELTEEISTATDKKDYFKQAFDAIDQTS